MHSSFTSLPVKDSQIISASMMHGVLSRFEVGRTVAGNIVCKSEEGLTVGNCENEGKGSDTGGNVGGSD
jgi:hypothetical protein